MRIKFLTFILLVLSISFGTSQAADIRLLDNNPIIGNNYQLLNNAKGASAFGVRGSSGRIPSRGNLKEISDGILWSFKDGLALDGALSFADIHLSATWGVLPSSQIIEVSGQIKKGDTDKLIALVNELGFSNCLRENYCPVNNTIAFNSPGGSLTEAIKMGQYISSQNFATFVDQGARCESACVFAFLAGFTNYEGFFYPRRYVHAGGKLGVHQPYFQLADQDYSLDQVQNIVKVVNLGINAATDYLLSSGISFRFLQKMYATPPDQMFYLKPADLDKDGIFILGPNENVSAINRREFFKYCASNYVAKYSEASPDLLTNLQSSGSEFLTFVNGKDFVCLGVKQFKKDLWQTEICFDGNCPLASFGQGVIPVELPNDQNKTLIYWDIATSLDNGGLGYALDEYSRRSALLRYMRMYVEHYNFTTTEPLTSIALQNEIPSSYCKEIDGFNPGLVIKVQEMLNQFGINVGKPDGAAGPNTRKGIRAFNKQRTGRDMETIDAKTLSAMNFTDSQIAEYKLCL